MSLVDWARKLDRLQQTLGFKIVASAVLTALAVGAVLWYVVALNAPPPLVLNEPQPAATTPAPPQASTPEAEKPKPPTSTTDAAAAADAKAAQVERSAAEAMAKVYNGIVGKRADPTAVALGAGVVLALCLLIVWMGIGLTYLALGLVTALVVYPMIRFGGNVVLLRDEQGAPSFMLRSLGGFLAAIVSLTASFTALMQSLRLALFGRGPVTAIARNVVNEAVRMKISLVFIVLLIFWLASLPGLLHEGTPLRYRVQSFLQYGTGGTFWLIAILTVFLATATVAFEQRDKVIWQTMTKPVRPWQYLLGKWIGVSGVAAVLLAVATSGVFLFTEYLRFQPAPDEIRAYVPRGDKLMSEDRLVLESQILAAREVERPLLSVMSADAMNELVKKRIEKEQQTDSTVTDTPDTRRRLYAEIDKERLASFLTIEPGGQQQYVFSGLKPARGGDPLALRYQINAAGNDPRQQFRITFYIEGSQPIVREVPLGQSLTLQISTAAIQEGGTLTVTVINGDVFRDLANTASLSFPPDGLELYYSAGSYRWNFLRVMVILWIKLAFLSVVGIAAATCLSFSVASMVSFGVLLVAEGAGYLAESLEYYATTDQKGNVIIYKAIIRAIALPISESFKFYANLKPTANLVDGRLVPLTTVLSTVVVLGGAAVILYAIGVTIFRNRELATYSGQ